MAGVYIDTFWTSEKVVLENIAPRVQGGTDSVKYTSFSATTHYLVTTVDESHLHCNIVTSHASLVSRRW